MSELPHAENSVQFWATIWFVIALTHTFLVKKFQAVANRMPEGSVGENLFHLLGEVEVVFGFYSAVFLSAFAFYLGKESMLGYLDSVNFTEPAFVFAIMVVAATRPVLQASDTLIRRFAFLFAKLFRIPTGVAFYSIALILGPLLGSIITEPAAMTVTAILLKKEYYDRGMSTRLMYLTLGLLFVNVSIGGTLTPFAAPPVLMVAAKWNWDLAFMMTHFGYKTMIALVVSTFVIASVNWSELSRLEVAHQTAQRTVPFWVVFVHVLFLVLIVWNSHHLVVFIGALLLFLGVVEVCKEYNDELKLKEALMVAFFLSGLVILGNQQGWWLSWVLQRLDALALFLGATTLTAVTDNAALTFLGTQVPGLTEASKYALVAGAVTGGGLTVIANAPNPAGYGILNPSFGNEGINPLGLFVAALPPTVIAAIAFWVL